MFLHNSATKVQLFFELHKFFKEIVSFLPTNDCILKVKGRRLNVEGWMSKVERREAERVPSRCKRHSAEIITIRELCAKKEASPPIFSSCRWTNGYLNKSDNTISFCTIPLWEFCCSPYVESKVKRNVFFLPIVCENWYNLLRKDSS